jgi:hypothetical protein
MKDEFIMTWTRTRFVNITKISYLLLKGINSYFNFHRDRRKNGSLAKILSITFICSNFYLLYYFFARDVGLYDTIKLEMVIGNGDRKETSKGCIFLPHRDLFTACSLSLLDKSLLRSYVPHQNNPNKGGDSLGIISLELRCTSIKGS